MASKNKAFQSKRPKERPAWFNEVVGVVMIGLGLLLLLSLMSFTDTDLPAWIVGERIQETGETQNHIGVVGALVAWVCFEVLGAASFFLAVGLMWLGAGYAFFETPLTRRKWIGFGLFIVIGACLASVISLFGGGGVLGKWIGVGLFQKLFAKIGAILLLGFSYIVGLIMLTGMHPVRFTRELITRMRRWWQQRAQRKSERAERDLAREQRRAERAERVRQRRESVAALREQTVKEREREAAFLKQKEKKEQAEQAANPQVEMPLKEQPKPQIIDSSKRKVAPIEGDRPFAKSQKTEKDNMSLSTDGFEDYVTPGYDLLNYDDSDPEPETNEQELVEMQNLIINTLNAFGVDVTAGDITRGPTITRYEVYPSVGLRVDRISKLEADIARATRAEQINILAPIPGKDTVGIEIVNNKKVAVPLRELLQDPAFTSSKKKIPLALGKDVYGETVIGDLAAMPHLLVAGATGSGKSVCINSIIASILFKFSPDELRFIMVDPKVVEMQMYSKLPHLVVPVVTDPNKVVAALRWVVNEMEKRYKMFAKCGVRNFDGFNKRPRPEKPEVEEPEELGEEEEEVDEQQIESIARALEDGELGPMEEVDEDEVEEDDMPDKIPYIVVIVDELADLMQTAPSDVESNIARIAQKARAAGIHLIIATQTPRADVVTGIIKANIPSRIAFQVSSALDSRVILDTKGAEKLVGKGDMLYLPPGSAKLERSQGAFVSDEEVEAVVEYCSSQGEQKFEKSIQESIERGGTESEDSEVSDADEEVIQRCMEVIYAEGKASTSLFQRRLRLGYTRAARMMDILEQRGVIGSADGAKARDILIDIE